MLWIIMLDSHRFISESVAWEERKSCSDPASLIIASHFELLIVCRVMVAMEMCCCACAAAHAILRGYCYKRETKNDESSKIAFRRFPREL